MRSEIRKKGNFPTDTYNALRKDAKPVIERLFKKYRHKLHPDSIEVALCREVYLQSAMVNVKLTAAKR